MRLSEVNGLEPSVRTFMPSDEYIDPLCVVGIEIEAENVTSTVVGKVSRELWEIKEDGSLRNGGREFASKPLFGKDISIALENIENAFSRSKAEITFRCGLHIHIDVSSFTTAQLLSFTCAYLLAEDALFKYVGEYRKHSIFCLPLTNTEGLSKYYAALKNGDRSRVYNAIEHTHKYNAFNVLPVLRQGSVEFRHHPGTWNAEKIKKWINIIQQLRLVGKTVEATDLVNAPYYELAAMVFGKFKDELCPTGEIDVDGWLMAKDMLNYPDVEALRSRLLSVYADESVINYKGNN